MRLTRIALAAVVVLASLAGAGAAAPDAGNDGTASGQAGPPDDLPGPVPEFVEGVLDTVRQFLAGALEGPLGPAVSEDAGPGSGNGGSDG